MQVVALNTHGDGRAANVVLTTAPGDLAPGILIPMNEPPNRLARVLGLARCPCVPVYELMLGLLGHQGASLDCAVLDGDESGIHSMLVFERDGCRFELPGHPADAIALAVRVNASVYATPAALHYGCALGETGERDPDSDDVTQWLQRVSPDDFHLSDGR
jgi:bifunctional DNase/RNase